MTAYIIVDVKRLGVPGDPAWGSAAAGAVVTLSNAAGVVAKGGWWSDFPVLPGTYTVSVTPAPGYVLAAGTAPSIAVTVVEGQTLTIPNINVVASPTQLGFYGGSTSSNLPRQLAAVSAALGRTPTLVNCTVDWTKPKSAWGAGAGWVRDSLNAAGLGLRPAVAIPMGSTADVDAAGLSFAAITAGSWDGYYTAIFAALANIRAPAGYLRIGWEFNLHDYPWAVTTPDIAASFAAAFQHITVLARGALPGWRIVWNPGCAYPGAVTTPACYPGDGFADVIGIDAYSNAYPYFNPAENADWNGAEPVPTATSWYVGQAMAFAASRGKPFAFCEVGAQGNDVNFPAYLGTHLAATPVEYLAVYDEVPYRFTDGSQPNGAAAWAKLAAIL